ncbi:MAG TPA: hypothetical protein VI318_10515 [Baekduia sp.]
MLDFSGIPMLDVAIGLAFLFFLLSVVCSSIGEVIAAIFKLRAKNLETGIRSLLGDPELAADFFSHWRIAPLSKPKRPRKQEGEKAERPRNGPKVVTGWMSKLRWPFTEIRRGGPSYVDPRTAALVLYDTVFDDVAKTAADARDQPASKDVRPAVKARLADLGRSNPQLADWLHDVVKRADDDVEAARAHLEERFNEVMDRATGWYKRRTQIIMFLVALAVAASINADTFNVADRLARDEPLRARVVAQATAAATTAVPGSTGVPGSTTTPGTPEDVRERLKEARATALPLGWGEENIPDHKTVWAVLLKVAGLLVTALALLLGAPFWFDVLGKFARVRSTGNRIGTPKSDETAPSDRDDRLKRAAPQSR